ncbi:PREDICTED: S-methyl-5'-thioadenosine phosphorylase-like isoform X2 [Priapulus caudatus]|uniref:S-methyl-5'-thioadenosine phosphorylase n=1 Tax=Priapulus caudatus TaxID=37621 RepID=A0ABM1E1Q4_PRICU|nr:PREDICTED: S-methyl-5'-thioadenosine phosphorylase-like isoform X2 [Priapulus caudatus]
MLLLKKAAGPAALGRVCAVAADKTTIQLIGAMHKIKPVKIGIVGGTGLDNPDILEGKRVKSVDTAFGKPSDVLVEGTIAGVDCVLLARHGRQHTILPSNVNYRANVLALKNEGCTHMVVTTACGSLKDEIQPTDFLILDQFLDRTHKRDQTFYDGAHSEYKGICHLPLDTPFCTRTSKILYDAAKDCGVRCHPSGTVMTIEGPRFSSRAESKLWKLWGADVINMTTVPEVVLAKEAGMCYAAIAMATDYDSWKENEEPVSVKLVMETVKANNVNSIKVLTRAIPLIAAENWDTTLKENADLVTSSII